MLSTLQSYPFYKIGPPKALRCTSKTRRVSSLTLLQRHLLSPLAVFRLPDSRHRNLRINRLSVLAVRLRSRGLALSRIGLAARAAPAAARAARLLLGRNVVARNGVAVLVDVLGRGQRCVRWPFRGHARAGRIGTLFKNRPNQGDV